MARVSKRELYRLRNEITIDRLISCVLEIPSRTTDGRFRFRCPLCNDFNTAVKPESNLARCFTCEKNFNTIDFTMLVKNLDFIASVDFLRRYLEKDQNPCRQSKSKALLAKPPAHISDVLTAIMPDHIDDDQSMDKRLLFLEQKVEHLIQRLDELAIHLQ